MQQAVTNLRSVAFKYIGAMFLETKDGEKAVSLGRVAFLCVFGIALWKWAHDGSPPDTMLTAMYSLLGYVGGGKVVHAVKEVVSGKQP